jgi:hypothetical protein
METLQGEAAEVARDLEARYQMLREAPSRRSSLSFLNIAAFSFVLIGSMIVFNGYHVKSASKLGGGFLLASAGLVLAGWARRRFSGEPLDPPERLPDLAQMAMAARQLSGLPFQLEVDLKRPDRLRGTFRGTAWNALLEWEYLNDFTHHRSFSHQQMTPLEKRQQLRGELSSQSLAGRPWSEGSASVKVHTKRLLVRLEVEGWLEAVDGAPTEHLNLLDFTRNDTGSIWIWEFPKNHSEKPGLGFDGRPDLGVQRINRHHPEFVGEQAGRAIAWLFERSGL